MANPRRSVSAGEIAAIADQDARENWQVMIDFRDHLLAHPTIEAAYVALVRQGIGTTPPLFLDQLVHVILRNALDGCDDPYVLRAAELFFRPQRVTIHEGSLLAADEERIAGETRAPVSPLVSMLGLERSSEIDVLNDANAHTYWARSDRFEMALDLTGGRRGTAALGEVIARWIGHVMAVAVEVRPLAEVRNAVFTWYVGLDAEATKIGDALWRGDEPDNESFARVVALYSLRFVEPSVVSDRVADEPAYLILAMTPDKVIRVKPQNLVSGLPIKRCEAVLPDARSNVSRLT
jgi:hypothetical protein